MGVFDVNIAKSFSRDIKFKDSFLDQEDNVCESSIAESNEFLNKLCRETNIPIAPTSLSSILKNIATEEEEGLCAPLIQLL